VNTAAARRVRRAVMPTTLLLAAVGLAACSSGTSSRNGTTTTRPHPSTTTTSAAPTTSTTSSGGSTTTTAMTVSTCQPSNLNLSVSGTNGAAGTIELTIQMVNTGPPCTLQGYPGMQLLSSSGSSLPTNVVRGGPPTFTNPAANQSPSLVHLATHGTAAFSLTYSDVPVGTQTVCPNAAKAEVTPPNDTAFAVMTLQVADCGNGTIHLSPVYAA
jgi:Domain of unknown function (DUF4232)